MLSTPQPAPFRVPGEDTNALGLGGHDHLWHVVARSKRVGAAREARRIAAD